MAGPFLADRSDTASLRFHAERIVTGYRIAVKPRLAQTPVLWGLRLSEGACGSPRPTTKSRGPTEQVHATIAHLSRLVELHAGGECARDAGCQVPGTHAGAGRYEKLSASRFLPTAYWLLPTAVMRPSAPARAKNADLKVGATKARGARPEAERSPRRPLLFHQRPWNPNPEPLIPIP